MDTTDHVAYLCASAVASLRSGINVHGVAFARDMVARALAQVERLTPQLPPEHRGPARALHRAICVRTYARLSEATGPDVEDAIDRCVYWAGSAMDWSDRAASAQGFRRDLANQEAGAARARAEVALAELDSDQRPLVGVLVRAVAETLAAARGREVVHVAA